jgi:hypothetical protein
VSSVIQARESEHGDSVSQTVGVPSGLFYLRILMGTNYKQYPFFPRGMVIFFVTATLYANSTFKKR